MLLVDDEAVVCETLAPYLSARLHVEVCTAANAEEAMEHLREERFSVVVADHSMPGMSGLELLHRLLQEQPRVARVLITAYGGSKLREAAREQGHAFVEKPYSLQRMERLLRTLMDGGSHRDLHRRRPLEAPDRRADGR